MHKKKIETRNANLITSEGSQYHIGCKRGDIATNIILVGDPQRAFRFSNQFDRILIRRHHRKFITYTGTYKNFPLSVMAIGIGEGNMEIAMVEICQIVDKPVIIRCGTSSGLQKNIALGDMVITRDVLDLGCISSHYKINFRKVKPNFKILDALAAGCLNFGIRFHVGKTASAPGFYGPQGRKIKGFPIKKPNLISTLVKKKVLNLEMEMAALYALASCKGIAVGGICSAIGNRIRNDFLDTKGIMQAEKNSIACVLKAFEFLHQSYKGTSQKDPATRRAK